jgi:hypothetical protein
MSRLNIISRFIYFRVSFASMTYKRIKFEHGIELSGGFERR